MSLTFYWYPKCGTCRKAKKWLEEHGKEINEIHIAEQPPSKEELKALYEKSGLDLKKFFNTSGMKYREGSISRKSCITCQRTNSSSCWLQMVC